MKYWQTALAILAALSASLALADDFKTNNGKEYKNATVSRVEPDGIVVKTKSGITKIYFIELPKEIQKQFKYDSDKATAYSVEQNANLRQMAEVTAKNHALSIIPAESAGLRIEHESYGMLASKAETKARNLNYGEDRTNALVSTIPAGGRLVLHIERSTIGAANTEYFTMIVFDRDGKEIVRQVGSNDIANVPSANGMWWNIMVVDLPKTIEPPVKIRVVDTLSNTATEFNAQ